MLPLKRALSSPIGRKFVMSISGIALVLFVIVHLLGNLTLYIPDGGESFNRYAAGFEALGPMLYVMELGLLAVILLHAFWGISTWLRNRRARPERYAKSIATKGGGSNLNIASRNMAITGSFLFFFLIIHVWHFRVRKETVGEKTTVNGQEATDLYALVVGSFENPAWVFFYTVSMVVLAFHLRHGFWSALQSLGAMKPRWSKQIYAFGLIFAILLALGFLGMPIYLFLAAA